MKPAGDVPGLSASGPISDIFTNLLGDLTGKVVMAGLEANVRSAERQQELDQRVIPGVPYDVQMGYLGLIVLGLIGVPVSRTWWRKLWPPETASEYAVRSGYVAARLIRALVFLVLFLPLTAPVSAPYALLRQAWDAVLTPVRWWRWLTRRTPAPTPG
jgi:hypothetical protein